MGIKDIFNASKIKAENENLKSLMTPELQDASNMMAKITELKKNIDGLQSQLLKKQTELAKIDSEIENRKSNVA